MSCETATISWFLQMTCSSSFCMVEIVANKEATSQSDFQWTHLSSHQQQNWNCMHPMLYAKATTSRCKWNNVALQYLQFLQCYTCSKEMKQTFPRSSLDTSCLNLKTITHLSHATKNEESVYHYTHRYKMTSKRRRRTTVSTKRHELKIIFCLLYFSKTLPSKA